ncbi:cytotoxin [Rouxiella silvae]|uniref:Toxin CcdB n=1 Tax=Rouxiella silvae TaxID=1646373 RepID=A0AA40X286_9GAMM|nr:CcdB family protein [Rouxiella silvae]KQN52255.1 cytotoxin [Serratia sp. Leaf50]MBF6637372.1 CcdB family protein [Rouxiella silvae]ORJ19386.1 cytotoxin [Rouxiella silvae]
MQFMVYRNTGNARAYPYLLDVQSDIIGEMNTRLVIPLFPLSKFHARPAQRLNPVVKVEGVDYLLMTHEMASIRLQQLGAKVVSLRDYRHAIKNALDFLLDGF